MNNKAIKWLRWSVTGLSQQRPSFMPGSVRVGFVVDKVALGQVFLQVLQFSPINIIPQWLIYSYITYGMNNNACWSLQFGDVVSPHRHEKQGH
jgi:hypothetical protein